MNLFFTLTSYPPAIGGAQVHTHLLLQELQKKHDVSVACHWNTNRNDWLLGTTLKHPSASQYILDRIKVNQLGFSRAEKWRLIPNILSYYPLMQLALPSIANTISEALQPLATQADLIHNIRIGREGISWASLKLARKKNIPFVFTPLHHPRWIGWRYREYIKLYQKADALIALTPHEKQILIALGVSSERIHVTGVAPVLANNPQPANFRKIYGLSTEPFVLFLGQHYSYKGYRELLASMQIVWKKIPETNFVFIGPSVKQSDEIFRQFTDHRVKRLGKVSLQEKTDALAACSLLCVPSIQESFGGVYTEAWSFEKPVIAGDIPAIRDVVSNEEDGFLVDQNPESIAARIIALLLDSQSSTQMGKAGKKKLDMLYSWSALAKKTDQVYQSLF